jgi:hypothetical protein
MNLFDIRLIFYQLNLNDYITDIILYHKNKLELSDEIDFQIKRYFFHSWIGGVVKITKYPYNDIYNSLYSPNIYRKYKPLKSHDILFYIGGPRNNNIKNLIWNRYKATDRMYSDYLRGNIIKRSNPPFYIGKWINEFKPKNDNDYFNINQKKDNNNVKTPTMLKDLNHYSKLINNYLITTDDDLNNYNYSDYIKKIYEYCNCERCIRINGYSKQFLETMNVI